MSVVPYGTVTDTTSDPRWSPMLVTAHMADPVVAMATHPAHLDGPLSWAAAESAIAAGVRLPPLLPEWAPDLVLPLAQWTAPYPDDTDPRLRAADPTRVWGWACSAAIYTPDLHTKVEVRRRPATAEMARYSTARSQHLGLGPHKARQVTHPAEMVRRIDWYALGDIDQVADLLTHVTHLGRIVRHGHGRILRWTVERHQDRDAWKSRSWPHPDGTRGAIRAPYWHHTRSVSCSSTPPA